MAEGQAGRERKFAALLAHGARCGHQTPRAARLNRPVVRRQFVLMTLAITSMVVIAFVIPLAFLVRTIAADRATSHANADAQYVGQIIAGNRAGAPALVAQADASAPGRISVYYADGVVIGDRSRPPADDSLQLARRGRSFSRST